MKKSQFARLYRYALPIQTRLILRGNELTVRQGLIVHLQQGEKHGLGEIAPLMGFSRETLPQAEIQAKQWLAAWQQNQPNALDTLFPSVAFGISAALAELAGTLEEQARFQTVPLCFSEGDAERLTNVALAKMKVGVQAVKNEGSFANALLMKNLHLRLRFDANRKWSLDEALAFANPIGILQRQQIDFIEEPCHTPELSREFAKRTGIHIAWDETTREDGFRLMAEENVSAVVIKPTLMGSLEKCQQFIKQAQHLGLQVVISSSIESSLGLTQLARFATQHTPNTIAGLDTLHLMQHQLLRQWQGSTLPVIDFASPFITQIAINGETSF